MFGDRACPQCGRTLLKRFDPVGMGATGERKVIAVFACSSCGKDWPSCPRCGGLVVEKPRPGDLFTPVIGSRQACTECLFELPKKVAG